MRGCDSVGMGVGRRRKNRKGRREKGVWRE